MFVAEGASRATGRAGSDQPDAPTSQENSDWVYGDAGGIPIKLLLLLCICFEDAGVDKTLELILGDTDISAVFVVLGTGDSVRAAGF